MKRTTRTRAIITAATQAGAAAAHQAASRRRPRPLADARARARVRPDEIAVAVLKLCDGARIVDDIAGELAKEYNAPTEEIVADIIAMLQDLADKGVVKA